MIKWITKWVLVIGVILAGSACEIGKVGDPILIADVEEEFTVELQEKFSPGKRELLLKLATVKQQDCSNYQIRYQWLQRLKQLQLSIRDLVRTSDCQPGPAPALATVTAGNFATGDYELTIDLQQTVVNEGILTITPELYRIKMNTEYGLSFLNRELRQIPNETIWGYIAYSPAKLNTARELRDALQKQTQGLALRSGDYGYFSASASNISLKGVPGNLTYFPLVRRFTGQGDELAALIGNFRDIHGAELQVVMQDTNGRIY